GVVLARILRALLSVCEHARGHQARDGLVAVAALDVHVHVGAGIRRGARGLSARQPYRVTGGAAGPQERRVGGAALEYLSRADSIPRRTEGESALLEEIPANAGRVLDLGCGDGRLLALVLTARPAAIGIAVDFSPPMLERVRQRFAGDDRVRVVEHNLDRPLPDWGSFDAVVSSF